MYAIIETGGKQYRVEKDDVIDVELLEGEMGSNIEFANVLFAFGNSESKIGTPHVANCVVVAELLQEVRGPKVICFKYKKRKRYRRKVGHRQNYSRVKIKEIRGLAHGT